MKIVIDGRGLRLSTGRYTRKLLDYLQKLDTQNQYVVLINPEDESAWTPLKQSTNFERITVNYRHYSFGEQISFARYLYGMKADLVHFTMPQQPLLYLRPKVTTIHDLILLRFKNVQKSKLDFAIKQFVFRYFVKVVARQSKIVLTVTDFVKKDIADYTGISPDKIVRTHLSADKIAGKSRSIEILSKKRFIFYVGTGHVHKNLPRVLQAFEVLKQTHPDLELAFAGKKTIHYERLELLAAAMEDSKSIHVLGFISDEQLKWLYENAAVYVFATLDEGFGLPGLEAMQYDVPVAASNVSCLPEVYGDSVEYFNPLDPTDIARGVATILDDKRYANSLVSRGHKQLQKYSWQTMAKQVHEAYLQAANE